MENIFLFSDYDSVSGICPASATCDYVSPIREEVYEFAFTSITPLIADYCQSVHTLKQPLSIFYELIFHELFKLYLNQ